MKKQPIKRKMFCSRCPSGPQFRSEVTKLLYLISDRAHQIDHSIREAMGLRDLAGLLARLSSDKSKHPKATIYPEDENFDQDAVLLEIDADITKEQRQVISCLHEITKTPRAKPIDAVFKLT